MRRGDGDGDDGGPDVVVDLVLAIGAIDRDRDGVEVRLAAVPEDEGVGRADVRGGFVAEAVPRRVRVDLSGVLADVGPIGEGLCGFLLRAGLAVDT